MHEHGAVTRSGLSLLSLAAGLLFAGCDGDESALPSRPSGFELRFSATAGGQSIGCSDQLAGVGANEDAQVGLSDLRFYVSNLRFADAAGKPVEATLNDNEFQYNGPAGSVALIDATSNREGSCGGAAIAFAEGTERTNLTISGRTRVADVAAVSFDVGVPQPLMQEMIATHTPEGAPSPLNEMFWSWASGYRHFVLNFTVQNADGVAGEGYLHIGSRDCGPEDGVALEDRDRCGFVNTPRVSLTGFDLARNVIALDVPRLLHELPMIAPVYDPQTFEVLGEGPGAQCHSSPTQPDCGALFSSLGLDLETGKADAAENEVFGVD